ncbi:MAG TPA: ABC transporter ATP-binding protein [Streptosporangiaceae bacterium]|jgi:putative ABC transport system ATP-binding protein|nr:ABC transporter ATP-binding protein [Streptosporangiaceae bacterium]
MTGQPEPVLVGSGGPALGGKREPAARTEALTRTFGQGSSAVHALRGVSITVQRGELIAICGRSGSGKTTLLNLLAGLDRPTSGRAWVAGLEVTAMSRDEQLRLRRDHVSLVFQSFALLPMLSAAENIGVPMRLAKMNSATREKRVTALLELVGLPGYNKKRPHEMSGGEQQRVGLARALANNAELLLADEPTGQLDSQTARQIMGLIRTIVHGEGITAIATTHDRALMDLADRVLTIENGQILPEVSGSSL